MGDFDLDGIPYDCDNCLAVENTAPRDTDQDGYGNRFEADFDNGGSVTIQDVALFIAVFNSDDQNAAFDGGGSVNFFDVYVLVNA